MHDDTVNDRFDGGFRGPDGKFQHGNRAAKGNPVYRRMMELRRTLLECADPETLQAIFRKIGQLAKDGDMVAARLYLEFSVGKATQPIEMNAADSGEPVVVKIISVASMDDL
jgi:hypothetical protein